MMVEFPSLNLALRLSQTQHCLVTVIFVLIS